MSDLYKKNDYIIDVENSAIHGIYGGDTIIVDFERWYCSFNKNKSQRKPVRYCQDNNGLVYWVSGSWKKFKPDTQEAINSLFNSYFDNELLS